MRLVGAYFEARRWAIMSYGGNNSKISWGAVYGATPAYDNSVKSYAIEPTAILDKVIIYFPPRLGSVDKHEPFPLRYLSSRTSMPTFVRFYPFLPVPVMVVA